MLQGRQPCASVYMFMGGSSVGVALTGRVSCYHSATSQSRCQAVISQQRGSRIPTVTTLPHTIPPVDINCQQSLFTPLYIYI